MDLEILKYYTESVEGINDLEFEVEESEIRPAWIFIKNPKFKARFIFVRTKTSSGEIYRRFTGNFYYPNNNTQKEKERFYEKYAQHYDQNTATNNLSMAKFLMDKMISVGIRKESKILDLGAGTGIFSNLAYENGYRNLTLVDISREMLNEARKKPNLADTKFIAGDVTKIKLNETYDVLVSIMMLDSLDDDKLSEALKNVLPAIQKNGYIFLMEDKHRSEYEYDKYFEKIEDGMFTFAEKDDSKKYYFIGRKL